MPSNGARMRSREAVACASASFAWATSRLAALSSTERWLMKPWATSSWLRLWLAWAMDSSAWACCTWARGNWSSNCTSTWPWRTRWPSVKLSWVMRPLTSGRSTTLRRERRLPTASASSRSAIWRTGVASTATTRPAPPGPPGPRAPVEEAFPPAGADAASVLGGAAGR